ncbi:LysR family transcriptional regulator [Sinorhizobium sp. Sb3]|uniref:LysR family transcriptional regulator n=1 Tax=Sinorhizobium/Ensifer group TaxID=227292 RepID=UPI001FD8B680|nr:LysR family transcriptional regulator [Sinorhizobium sp. Sb3]
MRTSTGNNAVSQQIQALESEVRAELFDRSTRPITLNSQSRAARRWRRWRAPGGHR